MSEVQEATSLAQWLDSEPGTSIPEMLDEDVVESIIALRPEFALPARTHINDILASLTEGPLVDPAIAAALQSWIESEPGTPPPAILPIGIVEATYALRPDLAPAPRVSIDDILQSVTSGPLASSPTEQDSETPTPVVQLDDVRSRRRVWAGPTVGALAVAAIALFFVKPIAHKSTSSDHTMNASLESAVASQAPKKKQVLLDASFESTEKSKESAPINHDTRTGSTHSIASKEPSVPPPAKPSTKRSRGRVSSAPPAPMAPPAASEQELEPQDELSAPIEDSMLMEATGGSIGATDGSLSNPSAHSYAPPIAAPKARRPKRESRRAVRSAPEADAMPMDTAKKDATVMDFEAVEMEVGVLEEQPQGMYAPATRSRMSENDVIINAAIHRAEQFLTQGKPAEALSLLESALQLEASNPFLKAKVWRTKAKAFDGLGHEKEAKQARQTAAKLDPAR
ncbi:MAG: hypothetical protein ACPGTU_01210 [Myxococcota bacterium]